jgi:hypothetical protein
MVDILLPTVFGALLVWFTVRLVNRRKRPGRWFWLTTAALLLYVLSSGPARLIMMRKSTSIQKRTILNLAGVVVVSSNDPVVTIKDGGWGTLYAPLGFAGRHGLGLPLWLYWRLFPVPRSKLNEEAVTDEERRSVAETLALLEAELKWPENMVRSWKFNRALYIEYGGPVISQQSNPFEPVGAYRKWLEAHEQASDFAIFNDDDRAAFWEYFKQDWEGTHYVVNDPDPLGQPWWLKEPAGEDEDEAANPTP